MDPIHVLHVEDDAIQQALIAHYLGADDQNYVVTGAKSEDEAVDEFQRTGIDLVILDYQLAQGDGLNCLRQIRLLDPLVPVIALSGVATAAIAAELIEAGADDYLSKRSLDAHLLSDSMKSALERARGVRARLSAKESGI